MAAEQDRPDQNGDAGVFCDGEALYQDICRDGPEEVAKVEDGCDPGVSLAMIGRAVSSVGRENQGVVIDGLRISYPSSPRSSIKVYADA